MKYLLYTDPHICTDASIVTGKIANQTYTRYSAREDMCINTFNFINYVARDKNVDKIVCLGDLVESSNLSAEEISTISDCHIENHLLLVGNHDVSTSDNYFNTCNLYGNAIREVKIEKVGKTNIVYLPWTKEPIDLDSILKDCDPNNTVILSHNDIAGIMYGSHLNDVGYHIEKDILKHCRLFINGHLHSGSWIIPNRILNLGTVTGLNFNNCNGFTGKVVILDTDTLTLEWLDNPFAFKFIDIKVSSKLELQNMFVNLDRTLSNVVQIRAPRFLVDICREKLDAESSIIFSRILTTSGEDPDKEAKTDIDTDLEGSGDAHVNLTSNLNIYELLRQYVNDNCPESKYDKVSVLNEIDILERGV